MDQVFKVLDDTSLQSKKAEQKNDDSMKLWRRAEAQVADRQTGFGYRDQLIPDGLEDPLAHVNAARLLKHPFDTEAVFPPDLAAVFDSVADTEFDINSWRQQALK